MNAATAREEKKDINYYWLGEQEISKMNQSELLEYAEYLGSLPNESFEESASRFRDEEDEEIAEIFDEMTDKWFELEG